MTPCLARVPGLEQDTLATPDLRARHIVVQRGPRFYRLDVVTASGEPVDAGTVESQLRAILADSAGVAGRPDGSLNAAAYKDEPPVGALTGERSEMNVLAFHLEKSLLLLGWPRL